MPFGIDTGNHRAVLPLNFHGQPVGEKPVSVDKEDDGRRGVRDSLHKTINHFYLQHGMLDKLSTECDGFYAVLQFWSILYELSQCEYRQLSSTSYAKFDGGQESRRILDVQDYITLHYAEQISLGELAKLAEMSPTSFSRFFKLRTGKNVTDFIIDYRLGLAVRLLVDTNRNISEICYGCGFINLSNFNRIFRKKKGCSPKEFRQQCVKKKLIV